MHAIRSIEIMAPYEKAFAFIADPKNLPAWAEAFETTDRDTARLRTPNGTASIALKVTAAQDAGTIDWTMTFEDGTVGRAMSRLTRADSNNLVYSFVLNAPPVPLEQLEGVLEEQTRTLEKELATLKRVVETQ